MAREAPISLGRSRPTPWLAKMAFSERMSPSSTSWRATRKSQARAVTQPAPWQRPLSAATIGLGVDSSVRTSSWWGPRVVVSSSRSRSFGPSSPASSMPPTMSSPEQKARPAPVMTTTRTAGSGPAAATQRVRPSTMPHVRAFNLSGRSNVRVSTPPSRRRCRPSTWSVLRSSSAIGPPGPSTERPAWPRFRGGRHRRWARLPAWPSSKSASRVGCGCGSSPSTGAVGR